MKICSKCGIELKDDAAYCNKCGSMQQNPGDNLGEKKMRVLTKERKGRMPMVAAAVVVFVVVSSWAAYRAYTQKSPGASQAASLQGGEAIYHEPVRAEKGLVRISLRVLLDNKAHFYTYSLAGREIKFFLLRAQDGTIRAALDACNTCYRARLGYKQEADLMICNNCGMTFRPFDIGVVTGGCNPIPMEKTLDSQAVLIKAKDIEAGVKFF